MEFISINILESFPVCLNTSYGCHDVLYHATVI